MSLSNNYPTIKPSLLLDFSNTKQLDPRITFTRTSTATYYDGVTTAMAEQNLLTYSQEFDNAAWVKTGLTVAANSVVAPDGTTTAEIFSEGTSTGYHSNELVISTVIGQTYTYSAYAKNTNGTYVNLSFYSNSNASLYAAAVFNISTGVVTGSGAAGAGYSVVSSNITESPVGSGWYRCSITVTNGSSVAANRVIAAMSNTGTISSFGAETYTGTSRSINIWGAQLEQRSSVTAYTATTTQPITNYIPVLLTAAAGVPRFNHNPTTGESLGLLIEESRTNLLTYSADWSNAAWSKSNATVTANTVIAPDGTLAGDKLVENTTNGSHTVAQGITVAANTAISISIYVQPAGRNLRITVYTASNGLRSIFNFSTLVVTNASYGNSTYTSGTITSVGNGWYRIILSGIASSTEANPVVSFELISGSSTVSYQGDGFSGIYLWGSQLEAGSFSTSYVPTITATVTRSADSASMTGTNFSSWYRPNEGAFYSEFTPYIITGNGGVFSVNDGTANNRIDLRRDGFSIVTTAGAGQASMSISGMSASISNKISVGYAVNNFSLVRNGGSITTDTSGTVPSGLNLFQVGGLDNNPSFSLNGTIKKIAFYPARLTNAQLQALTTV